MVNRDPDKTREALLNSAFEEFYQHGFQAASLDSILATAGVTKGALYHHFGSKMELGYAVIEDMIEPYFRQKWDTYIASAPDPISGLQAAILSHSDCHDPKTMEFGCPLNNLAQEMSPVDEGFRKRIEHVFTMWRDAIVGILEHGQRDGTVSKDIDAAVTSNFIMASFEGAVSLAKNSRDFELFKSCCEAIADYLEALRPHRRQRKARQNA